VFWNEKKQAFLQRLIVLVGGDFCFFNCKVVLEEDLFIWLRLCEM